MTQIHQTPPGGTGRVDLDEARPMVMIGRSMLDLDDEVVKRLAQGLKERIDSAVQISW